MIEDFVIFILSHGRSGNVLTYHALMKAHYSGPVYIIIDNEDDTAQAYYDRFGDKVIMFDKAEIAKTFDEGDNFTDRRAIVYARNTCFQIAEDLGYTYFMELDDDYVEFDYRMNGQKEYPKGNFIIKSRLEYILHACLRYYQSIDAKSIALAQGGDFIGGGQDKFFKAKRKCMNTFFCSTERPFQFIGRINEDVTAYTHLGSKGFLFITIQFISITQKQTQSNAGGMTDLYLSSGTYVKSFYSVMYQPSSVRVGLIRSKHRRLHHHVHWNNTVPVIIDEIHKKHTIK